MLSTSGQSVWHDWETTPRAESTQETIKSERYLLPSLSKNTPTSLKVPWWPEKRSKGLGHAVLFSLHHWNYSTSWGSEEPVLPLFCFPNWAYCPLLSVFTLQLLGFSSLLWDLSDLLLLLSLTQPGTLNSVSLGNYSDYLTRLPISDHLPQSLPQIQTFSDLLLSMCISVWDYVQVPVNGRETLDPLKLEL